VIEIKKAFAEQRKGFLNWLTQVLSPIERVEFYCTDLDSNETVLRFEQQFDQVYLIPFRRQLVSAISSFLCLKQICYNFVGKDSVFTIMAPDFNAQIGTEEEFIMILEDQLKLKDPSVFKLDISFRKTTSDPPTKKRKRQDSDEESTEEVEQKSGKWSEKEIILFAKGLFFFFQNFKLLTFLAVQKFGWGNWKEIQISGLIPGRSRQSIKNFGNSPQGIKFRPDVNPMKTVATISDGFRDLTKALRFIQTNANKRQKVTLESDKLGECDNED
jgi:hypothetical protein